MQKRIVIYNNETLPTIEHFAKRKLVYELDGTRDPDVVREISTAKRMINI